VAVRYETQPKLDPSKLDELFRVAWGSPKPGYADVLARSFTWIAAMQDDELVGFVNVAWDGGVHFFLVDTTVHPGCRRQGIGSSLLEEAIRACRGHGEWLHVDAPEELMERLYEPRGFQRTPAGLLDLRKG
jgi:ribosomal protein S18 acetylase RimI-like enzyme